MRQRRLIASRTLGLALAGAGLILLLQAVPDAGPTLEYRRALLSEEPWRILGAHLVHVNWPHALVNAAAWIVLARLFDRELGAGSQLVCLVTAGVVISLALAALFPTITWYRGASGVLHALFFAGATAAFLNARHSAPPRRQWILLALIAGGWLKVALELPRGADTAFAAWLGIATVPQAHLVGACWGTALGLLAARRSPRAVS